MRDETVDVTIPSGSRSEPHTLALAWSMGGGPDPCSPDSPIITAVFLCLRGRRRDILPRLTASQVYELHAGLLDILSAGWFATRASYAPRSTWARETRAGDI